MTARDTIRQTNYGHRSELISLRAVAELPELFHSPALRGANCRQRAGVVSAASGDLRATAHQPDDVNGNERMYSIVPSPACPNRLYPQHFRPPSEVSAQVCQPPRLSAVRPRRGMALRASADQSAPVGEAVSRPDDRRDDREAALPARGATGRACRRYLHRYRRRHYSAAAVGAGTVWPRIPSGSSHAISQSPGCHRAGARSSGPTSPIGRRLVMRGLARVSVARSTIGAGPTSSRFCSCCDGCAQPGEYQLMCPDRADTSRQAPVDPSERRRPSGPAARCQNLPAQR